MTTEKELIPALAEATGPELVELYLAGDFDLCGACFAVLQRRPAGETLAAGLVLARSDDTRRRDFAPRLLTMGIPPRRVEGREAGLLALTALLDDEAPEVVASAIGGFGSLQVKGSVGEFGRRIHAAKEDPSLIPWREPMPAKIELGLLSRFVSHPDEAVRMQLGHALILCGDEAATRILLALADDGDEVVRATAANALGWKDHAGGVTPEVIATLWRMCADEDRGVRAEAVAALTKLRAAGAEEAFVRELQAAVDAGAPDVDVYGMLLTLPHLPPFLPPELQRAAEELWPLARTRTV